MKQVLCLVKEDIKTSVIGCNIWVEATPELSISFTREALDELLSDYKTILEKEAQCTTTTTTN